jgi:hypothetical protein
MTELEPYVFDGKITEECELIYNCCTVDATWLEDPYEADVNDNPGVMIRACPECYQELVWDI